MSVSGYTVGYDLPVPTLPKRGVVARCLGTLMIPSFLIPALLWPLLLVHLPMLLRGLFRPNAVASAPNISVTDQSGSGTARLVAVARAIAFECGFGPDAIIAKLLPHMPRSGPYGFFLSPMYNRLVKLQWWVTQTLASEYVARMRRAPASDIAAVHARTCLLDSMVRAFQARHPDGQLVILGAGYDTRCWRFGRGFEVDAPGTQTAKRIAVRNAGLDASSVTYVAVDFGKEKWLDKLVAAGLDTVRPVCIVWEGVIMYLPLAAVEDVLTDVSRCAPGSVIGFDYCTPDLMRWANTYLAKVGEKMHFAPEKEEVEPLVQRCGLKLLEHLRGPALQDRFSPRYADGQFLLRIGEYGGLAVAGVL